MKKLLSLFLAAALVLIFTACQQETNLYLDSSDFSISDGDLSSEDAMSSENTSTEEEPASSEETTSSKEQTASDNSSKSETDDTPSKKNDSSTPNDESKPTTPSTPQTATEYTVTFNPDNGSKSFTQKTSGGKVSAPANPQKSDYKFLGWYKGDSDKAWDFSSKISSDMILTARWELIEYTVTFDPKNDDSTFKATTVNNKVSAPEAPARGGYEFVGWYNEATDIAWDFSDKVSGDITLVAHWNIIEYTVTFDPNNDEDEKFFRTTVEHKVAQPADPENDDNNFLGWYIVGDTSTKWDFTQKVTGDMTLIAQWEIGGDHGPIIPF